MSGPFRSEDEGVKAKIVDVRSELEELRRRRKVADDRLGEALQRLDRLTAAGAASDDKWFIGSMLVAVIIRWFFR